MTRVGASSVTQDAAGNTNSDANGLRKFYYGAAGNLQWISIGGIPIAAYLYNGGGQRVGKLSLQGISLYHYDVFGRLISETTVGAQPSRDYVFAGDVPVAQINHWLPVGNMLQVAHCQPGSDHMIDWVTYLHADFQGTPRLGTDVSRNVVWRWGGEAFGTSAPIQSAPQGAFSVVVNLRAPGQYFDAESGLFYNIARYYNPQTGRYLSSDPLGLGAGLNSYAYVRNNPLNLSDPLGLNPGLNPNNLLAQEFLFGVNDEYIDPLLQKIQNGQSVTPEELSQPGDFQNEMGVPDPAPISAPNNPWWVELLKFFGSALDRFNNISPAAPPVCSSHYCA